MKSNKYSWKGLCGPHFTHGKKLHMAHLLSCEQLSPSVKNLSFVIFFFLLNVDEKYIFHLRINDEFATHFKIIYKFIYYFGKKKK